MACSLCSQTIDTDVGTTSVSCCSAQFHTHCFVEREISEAYYQGTIKCPGCSTVLWQPPGYPLNGSTSDGHADLAELQQDAQFQADLRETKKIWRQGRKGLATVKRLTQTEAQKFEEIIAPAVAQIKAAKAEAKQTLQTNPEFQTAKRELSRGQAARKRFGARWNLSNAQQCSLLTRAKWSWWRGDEPARIFLRRFRIGV